MVSSASASFLAGGSFGPLPPLRDRKTVQHPFPHSLGADVGAGRGSHPWVSSPLPTWLTTSLPNKRPSAPLLNHWVTPESVCRTLGWVAGLSLSDLSSAAVAARSRRQPKDWNPASTLRASVGVDASCPVILRSSEPEITVLSPVKCIHTRGRQSGKPSTSSIGSPAQKAGLVHLPEKVARPAPIRTPESPWLGWLAALLSACSFPDSVLPSSTPKNKGVGLNLIWVPSISTTGCHFASWESAEKENTLHFLRFKFIFLARAHQ
jgi:hypothetical protein